MLDKNKVYDAFYIHSQTPKRRNVRILYEDNIGYFVQSLNKPDSQGNGIRWSIKKHFYRLVEVQVPMKSDVCENCPLREISIIVQRYDI